MFTQIIAVVASTFLAYGGYRKKSLSLSGAVAGFFVGFVTTIASFRFSVALFTFFFTSSFLTKWKGKQKERGQRNWVQVLSNGGFATFLSIVFIWIGAIDGDINFKNHYWGSFIQLAILAHYSCTNGDTWASEVGVLSKDLPYHILLMKQVPAGTNGGISKLGTIASILGGVTIGISYYISGLLLFQSYQYLSLILVGALSGFLGSMLDSLLGATLQYSGWSSKHNKVLNSPSNDTNTIGFGYDILDNHQVNFLSATLTSIIIPTMLTSYYV